MAHPYHHAISSAGLKNWKRDYPIHAFFDSSKAFFADPRHRSFLHNPAGIFLAGQIFGEHAIPIGARHIEEDLREIPSVSKWLPGKYWNRSLPVQKKFLIEKPLKVLLHGNRFPLCDQADLEAITALLLLPGLCEAMPKENPARFFWFSSAGIFLAEKTYGPLMESKTPTRTGAEFLVKNLWGTIPSHQDIMSERPIEEWMFKYSLPLSKMLSQI